MAKVTIGSESFDWDPALKPLSEALALEAALKIPYAKWEEDMRAGSARATAGFIWLVWRRAGRDVSFADIESGKVDVDMGTFGVESDEGELDPTSPPPEASSTTGGSTSGSSPNGSGSAPGRSASSAKATSRRSSTMSKTPATDQG